MRNIRSGQEHSPEKLYNVSKALRSVRTTLLTYFSCQNNDITIWNIFPVIFYKKTACTVFRCRQSFISLFFVPEAQWTSLKGYLHELRIQTGLHHAAHSHACLHSCGSRIRIFLVSCNYNSFCSQEHAGYGSSVLER